MNPFGPEGDDMDDAMALEALINASNQEELSEMDDISTKNQRNISSTTEKYLLYGAYEVLKTQHTQEKYGKVLKLNCDFSVNRDYARALSANLKVGGSVECKRKGNSGRKKKFGTDMKLALNDKLKTLGYDITYSDLAEFFCVVRSTVTRFMKTNGYRNVGNYLKPMLTDIQIVQRKSWCQEHLQDDFRCTVDVDEKLFLLLEDVDC